MNVELLGSRVSKRDRNTNRLFGDVASITLVEKDENNSTSSGCVKMDWLRVFALLIPV